MNEERRQILEMLAEGKIKSDEAERLLDTLDRDRTESPDTPGGPKSRPKYLRVKIDSEESEADGPTRVNIQVPLKLLRAGVRLATLVPPQALERANQEISKSGVPIDLTELRPQQLDDLVDALDEVTVDIDDPGSKVRIFCE